MTRFAKLLFTAAGLLLVATGISARDELPQSTADGLQLVKDTDVAAVYVKPGATLEPYNKVMLVDAYVAFEKNWRREFNRSRTSMSRITDSDMERIKSAVAEGFHAVFADELTRGGYEVVTEAGEDVMILRPAIINLNVNAPDTNDPGVRRVFVNSAGSLTLYIELWDSKTSDKFAEIFDSQEIGERGFAYVANRVTNRQAMERALRHWAGLLVRSLDEAHAGGE